MASVTATEFEVVPGNTTKNLSPFLIGQLNLGDRTFNIQPILPSDKRNVSEFCKGTQSISDSLQQFFNNAALNHPLSGYVVRENDSNKIAALLCFNPDETKGELKMKIYVANAMRRKQLGTAIWKWSVEELFPQLFEHRVNIGSCPINAVTLVIKAIPPFLVPKAESRGFTCRIDGNGHQIAMRKLLNLQEEKGQSNLSWLSWLQQR